MDISKNFIVKRVVRLWSRLPREVADHLNTWTYLKDVYMWHLMTQIRGGPGSARLSFGLNDLKGNFQPN